MGDVRPLTADEFNRKYNSDFTEEEVRNVIRGIEGDQIRVNTIAEFTLLIYFQGRQAKEAWRQRNKVEETPNMIPKIVQPPRAEDVMELLREPTDYNIEDTPKHVHATEPISEFKVPTIPKRRGLAIRFPPKE